MKQKILLSLCMVCLSIGNLIAMQDISQNTSNNNHSSTMIFMSDAERSDNIIESITSNDQEKNELLRNQLKEAICQFVDAHDIGNGKPAENVLSHDELRDMINLWIQASNTNTPESIIGAFQLMLAHTLKIADDSLGIATESADTNSDNLKKARLILGDTGALSSNVLEIVKTIIVELKSDLSYEKKVQSIVGEFMDLLLTTSDVVGNHIADDKKAILTQVANTIGVVGNINNAGTLNSIWGKLFSCCCKNKKEG